MARKKKERSVEAFVKRFGAALYADGLNEDRVNDAVELLRKQLSSEFDPTGVLKFKLNHPTLWWWRAKIVGVTDGDTMDVFLDRGFRDTHSERIRLHRVNAWETRGKERPQGLKASRWAKKILTVNRELLVHTTGPDDRGNFGRWLAQLWVPISDEEDVQLCKLVGKREGGVWGLTTAQRLYGKDVPNIEGRVITEVPTLVNLGEWMLEMGHARPYRRKK